MNTFTQLDSVEQLMVGWLIFTAVIFVFTIMAVLADYVIPLVVRWLTSSNKDRDGLPPARIVRTAPNPRRR